MDYKREIGKENKTVRWGEKEAERDAASPGILFQDRMEWFMSKY